MADEVEKVELIPDPRKAGAVAQPAAKAAEEPPEPEETPADMWSDYDAQLDAADEELEKESVGETPPEPTPASKAEDIPDEEEDKAVAPKAETLEEKPAIMEPPKEEATAPKEVEPEQKPTEPQKTSEEIQKEFQEYRGQVMEKLVTQFQLSDEEADEFMTNPKEIVPKFAARLYLDVFESVMRGVHQSVPGMIVQTQEVRNTAEKAEQAFFAKWPMLQATQHRDTIMRLGAAYRQAHPQASTEQFINDVGAQAIVALRLPFEGMGEQVRMPEGVTPADNIPPPRPAGSGPVQKPVGMGSQNAFTLLDMEFDAEEDS